MDRKPDSASALYRETQYFRQPWLWALVMVVSLVSLYGAFQQLILRQPFGNNPAPDAVMIALAIVIGIGLPVYMYLVRLRTEVCADGLYFRFLPLHLSWHRIAPEEIARIEARDYNPIRDYGGWGIRYGRLGKAYNVRGNRGVLLERPNGQRLLIGSQRPEELAQALASIMVQR